MEAGRYHASVAVAHATGPFGAPARFVNMTIDEHDTGWQNQSVTDSVGRSGTWPRFGTTCSDH